MPDEFTAEEKAYVESRGEQGPAVEETTQEPVTPAEKPAEAEPEAKPVEQAAEERVPVAAIQEERRRRKEAEKQSAELRAQYERLAGRVEGLQERQPGQEQPQTEEDPLARLDRLERATQQQQQLQTIQAHHQTLGNRFDAAVNALKTEMPDVTQAIEHLVRSRERELIEVHGIPAEQVKPMLGQEMFQFLQNATQRGIDPARAAVQWARERGYQTVSRETVADPAAAARADIARTSAGQQAAKSLGQASGAPGGEITADAIADMPLDEFRSFMAKTDRNKLKAILGG